LSWYIGYGGHLGIWSEEWVKKNATTDKSNISVGFDGIIGLDYKVKNSPLNISIDWQPSFSIIQAYFKNQGGIGIRYVLK
jgi:outer membrane protein W